MYCIAKAHNLELEENHKLHFNCDVVEGFHVRAKVFSHQLPLVVPYYSIFNSLAILAI